jgi:magnesium-transporting ATPase (P-type)
MRRESDIVLRRACELGGGLHGIHTGRKFAFSINHNLANAMTYLITMQFFRIVLLVVPAMFGTHMLSALSLLINGMILDTAAVILFGFATPNQNAVASAYPIMRRLEKPITYNVANVISACVSALLVWLAFVLLQIFGVMNAAQSAGLGFASTYLLQGLVFAITLKEYAEGSKKKFSLTNIVIILAYLVLLLACIFVPGLNTLTGCNAMTWLAALLAPLASLFYIVTYRILSAHGLNLHK